MATLISEETDITSDRLTAEYVTVPQFYNGRSVFITGGTGFMGKVKTNKVKNVIQEIRLFFRN